MWAVTHDGKLLNLHYVRRLWLDTSQPTAVILADLSGPPYTRLAMTEMDVFAATLQVNDNPIVGPLTLVIKGTDTDA